MQVTDLPIDVMSRVLSFVPPRCRAALVCSSRVLRKAVDQAEVGGNEDLFSGNDYTYMRVCALRPLQIEHALLAVPAARLVVALMSSCGADSESITRRLDNSESLLVFRFYVNLWSALRNVDQRWTNDAIPGVWGVQCTHNKRHNLLVHERPMCTCTSLRYLVQTNKLSAVDAALLMSALTLVSKWANMVMSTWAQTSQMAMMETSVAVVLALLRPDVNVLLALHKHHSLSHKKHIRRIQRALLEQNPWPVLLRADHPGWLLDVAALRVYQAHRSLKSDAGPPSWTYASMLESSIPDYLGDWALNPMPVNRQPGLNYAGLSDTYCVRHAWLLMLHKRFYPAWLVGAGAVPSQLTGSLRYAQANHWSVFNMAHIFTPQRFLSSVKSICCLQVLTVVLIECTTNVVNGRQRALHVIHDRFKRIVLDAKMYYRTVYRPHLSGSSWETSSGHADIQRTCTVLGYCRLE